MPRLPLVLVSLLVILTIAVASAAQPPADRATMSRAQDLFDHAIVDFQEGRVTEAAKEFDALAALVPALAPGLWQRGIALYYAGRYQDCRAQFESHRTVNPNDVENAAWHFLCVARAETPEKARSLLLPVGPDARVPMRQVYEMFRGTLKPEDVLAAAGDSMDAEFYAHLYLGLYFEALGNERLAREHITAAAADRFRRVGAYMYHVARVHLGILQRRR
jgi:lipoprotein NlpI